MLRNKLKYWRHMHQMEQTEFAKLLGVHQSQYNRWERQVTQPNLQKAWEIAKKLKIQIEELFEEVEE